MKFLHRKTPADAPKNSTTTEKKKLNEVTVIIMRKSNLENYHETFLCDLSKQTTFEFNGEKYNMPIGKVTHYNPSFWQLGLKLALWFEQHKLWAKLFDWFHLRDHAVYELGYIYTESNPDPLKAERPKTDYALECWNIRHNTIIEKRLAQVGRKLSRIQPTNIKWLMIFGLIILIVVGAVVIINILAGNHSGAIEQAQNVTTTIKPTPFPLGGT